MGKPANYQFIEDGEEQLVIADIGPWDVHLTVTNDAERVVAELAPQLKGRKLVYFDSAGDVAELLVEDGRFAGFGPAPAPEGFTDHDDDAPCTTGGL